MGGVGDGGGVCGGLEECDDASALSVCPLSEVVSSASSPSLLSPSPLSPSTSSLSPLSTGDGVSLTPSSSLSAAPPPGAPVPPAAGVPGVPGSERGGVGSCSPSLMDPLTSSSSLSPTGEEDEEGGVGEEGEEGGVGGVGVAGLGERVVVFSSVVPPLSVGNSRDV